jgi:hypothetical protein
MANNIRVFTDIMCPASVPSEDLDPVKTSYAVAQQLAFSTGLETVVSRNVIG